MMLLMTMIANRHKNLINKSSYFTRAYIYQYY